MDLLLPPLPGACRRKRQRAGALQAAGATYGGFNRPKPGWGQAPPLAGKDSVHFCGQLLEAFGAVGAALFSKPPAIITNVIQRPHHGWPIIVAFEELHVEPFAKSLFVGLFAAEL